MSEPVFLDTVGLIALLNRDDVYHTEASRVFTHIGECGRSVMTTDMVLAEVGNGLARTSLRREVGLLIDELHTDQSATVIYADAVRFKDGLDLYRNRDDKDWGLIDCVSFALMKSMGTVDAFTADRHFEQAGFNCLLQTSPKR